ncbi:MAG: ABC transporter ATP-binding protein [Magnetococcales bacterium]|nr:ABC transporter ATP-binding protein [Magnetococcales bacterium]
MIQTRAVSHYYPGSRRRDPPRQALLPLDLQVEEGQFFALTGPNGGGKSTLFKILAGVMQPSAGEVLVGGKNLFAAGSGARQLLGVAFQKPALDRQLTVMENFRIHASLYGLDAGRFHRRLEAALSWSGLQDRLADRVGQLSGGLARQVELVKVLLHEPRILLLDEPTTGLDPGVRRAFLDRLLTLRREEGLTICLTSHLFEEAEAADRVGILKKGVMLANDTPEALKRQVGRNLLVLKSRRPEALEAWLRHEPAIQVQHLEGEMRLEGPDLDRLLARILVEFKEDLLSVSFKEATLEDLFIHLTGEKAVEGEVAA